MLYCAQFPEAGYIVWFKEHHVTVKVKKKHKGSLPARLLSVFLALLIVGGSLAALVELL